jgi:cation transport ATPase
VGIRNVEAQVLPDGKCDLVKALQVTLCWDEAAKQSSILLGVFDSSLDKF